MSGGAERPRSAATETALPTPTVLPGSDHADPAAIGPVPVPLEPMSASGAPARYREALRSREMSGLLLAQVVSECGDFLARVALALLVLARSDSAFLAALTFAIAFLPALFGGSLLSSLADRLPRKAVMLAGDASRAAVIGVLAFVAVDGTSLAVLLGLLFVAELFLAPYAAAQRAVTADILTEPRVYLAGSSLQRVLFQVDQVFGLVVAGLVVRAVGSRWALWVDALTFAFAFLVVLVALRPRPSAMTAAGQASRGIWSDFTDGWRVVFDDPARRILVLLAWGSAIVIIAPEAVALAYARADGAGPAVGGALMAALPAGAAVGSVLVSRLGPHRQVQAIVPLVTCACLPLLATCWAPPWWVAMPLWFLSGLCQGYLIPLIGTVNIVTSPEFRGRVNGLASAGFSVATASAFLFAGAIADLATPAVAVTMAGALGLAFIWLVRLGWPRGAIRRATALAYGPPPA